MMKKRKSMYVQIIRARRVLALCFVILISFAVSCIFKIAETDASMEKRLPVLMYHSILNDDSRAGDYVITPAMLEEDFKKINELGYTAVNCTDLIDFVYNGKKLPEKPVMITFDDGNYNNYTYVYPLLEKYNLKCVISVVGEFTDMYSQDNAVINDRYSYLTYNRIKEMVQNGRVEIGNHTFYMHNMNNRKGVLKRKGENEEIYKNTLISDIEKLQDTLQQKCGVTPVVFTYPYGAVNDRAKNIVKELGFKVTLGCQEGINFISNPESLRDIKRYNRSFDLDIAKILN